jgi:ABC-type multidrug transport system ATPase subunit/ABC-type multidrug transport system permease subunit
MTSTALLEADPLVAAAVGELVAIIGPSGAGKSTLLQAMADAHPSDAIGFVPQDDIVHRELPLRTMLRYAARLRLPASTTASEIDRAVDDTMAAIGLSGVAHTRVAVLSGGERKRASTAVELLARPDVLFLDEPTSGLDPSSAAALMRTLRAIADRGTAVVVCTHSIEDLRHCDRVIALRRGGEIAYDGPREDVGRHFGVTEVAEVYDHLDARTEHRPAPPRSVTRAPRSTPASSARHQWAVLTRRSIDVLLAKPLTLAIMFGSPALVIAMFIVLFERGAIGGPEATASTSVMVAFWTAFAGFFFGLTYGLLQIITERSIFRRERFVGVSVPAYVLAKVAVLVPVLAAVITAMLVVLQLLGRLPALGVGGTLTLTGTLLLDAVAALALGLLASALVTDVAQATLALPMLCFPAVLFSGGVVPVHEMATGGRAISYAMTDRWAFEAVGRQLDIAPSAGSSYADAFHGGLAAHWALMASFTVVLIAATVRALKLTPQARVARRRRRASLGA